MLLVHFIDKSTTFVDQRHQLFLKPLFAVQKYFVCQ